MDTRPIGIFDSGVGGLTVYKEIRNFFPSENIVYLADSKNFPYGNKSKAEIISIVKNNIEFLISKNVKAIIIACGTATTLALDSVKDLYNIPILGIIEPTALYFSSKSNIKTIGVIATKGSINSNVWANSISKYNSKFTILNQACPLLAPLAEEGKISESFTKNTIHEYMSNLHNVDALILGCTHYPLFTNILKGEVLEKTEIINPGTILAKYLKDFFNSNLLNSNINLGNLRIFLTNSNNKFSIVAEKLLKEPIPNIQIVSF